MIYDILDNYIGVPQYQHCLSLYWVIDPVESKYATTVIWTAMFFFLRVILQCIYTEPQPKKPRRPHNTGLKPHQLKTPTPKPDPRPQHQNPNRHTPL